jgi:hypothetical protein
MATQTTTPRDAPAPQTSGIPNGLPAAGARPGNRQSARSTGWSNFRVTHDRKTSNPNRIEMTS